MATRDGEHSYHTLADGRQVHYRIDGEAGPAVVMLGSLGTSLAMWDRVIEGLRPHFRIIRIDHPGHGGSDAVASTSNEQLAQDAIAILDRLEVSKAHCIGLSLGGMIAQILGLRHPERIQSLTLCATAAALPTAEFWNARADLVLSQGMGPIVDLSRPRWFTPQFAASPQATQILDDIKQISATGYAACCRAIAAFDIRNEAQDISVPTRLIAGRHDISTTVAMMAELAGQLQHSELQIIENGAHLFPVEQPNQVSDAIGSWLASFEGGAK